MFDKQSINKLLFAHVTYHDNLIEQVLNCLRRCWQVWTVLIRTSNYFERNTLLSFNLSHNSHYHSLSNLINVRLIRVHHLIVHHSITFFYKINIDNCIEIRSKKKLQRKWPFRTCQTDFRRIGNLSSFFSRRVGFSQQDQRDWHTEQSGRRRRS